SVAPREFSDDEAEFLASSAALVAGAIENARLYEETRRRVGELEQLTELAEAAARAEALDELVPEVVERATRLLRAGSCRLVLGSDVAGELAQARHGNGIAVPL